MEAPSGRDAGANGENEGGQSPADAFVRVDLGSFELGLRSDAGATGCGTGVVEPGAGEACDDGNNRDGDGCSADCRTIEKDFACPDPGRPCVYQVKCGDGVVAGNEQCEPPSAGNGCSAECRLEPGYVCEPRAAGQPASCRKTVCGDATREGSEACDDGNTVDGDGCGGTCALEPDCSSGVCTSKCGDGVKLAPEACDDGNTKGGDGCSTACASEEGFTCTDVTGTPPPRLNLLVTYRDFIAVPMGAMATRHPDFEIFGGSGITPNLVKAMTGADGKPVWDGRCTGIDVTTMCPYGQQVTTQANFDQWYRDAANAGIKVPGTLLLPRMANGAYVYDSGGAGFYPIDGKGWTAAPIRESTVVADAVINDGLPHNFGFTTEIHYFFQYRGGESLTFSGDDDVWIFVNRRLALDLGGMHTRLERTLSLDQSAATLGLTVGQLYEISLFHAERHSTGSNFKLTLTGFAPTSTSCKSACGDGILAPSIEQCDDGNTVDGDGCSRSCRFEITIP